MWRISSHALSCLKCERKRALKQWKERSREWTSERNDKMRQHESNYWSRVVRKKGKSGEKRKKERKKKRKVCISTRERGPWRRRRRRTVIQGPYQFIILHIYSFFKITKPLIIKKIFPVLQLSSILQVVCHIEFFFFWLHFFLQYSHQEV